MLKILASAKFYPQETTTKYPPSSLSTLHWLSLTRLDLVVKAELIIGVTLGIGSA
ncbi:MAG: hypothetical protein GX251_09010 [Firmicutes bacterium]|nr:hypothetical protein [Bacillota bacterium]